MYLDTANLSPATQRVIAQSARHAANLAADRNDVDQMVELDYFATQLETNLAYLARRQKAGL